MTRGVICANNRCIKILSTIKEDTIMRLMCILAENQRIFSYFCYDLEKIRM